MLLVRFTVMAQEFESCSKCKIKSKLVLANNELFNSLGSTVHSSWPVLMIPNPSKHHPLIDLRGNIYINIICFISNLNICQPASLTFDLVEHRITQSRLVGIFWWYCWWMKSCTTWDVQNHVNKGIFTISTGAGFLPSTVCHISSSHLGQQANMPSNRKDRPSTFSPWRFIPQSFMPRRKAAGAGSSKRSSMFCPWKIISKRC